MIGQLNQWCKDTFGIDGISITPEIRLVPEALPPHTPEPRALFTVLGRGIEYIGISITIRF